MHCPRPSSGFQARARACRRVGTFAFAWMMFAQLPLEAATTRLVIDGMGVDGHPVELPEARSGTALRLPPGPHRLVFSYGPPEAGGPPLRLRYRLEGVDEAWREAGGEMRLTLMVFNAAGEILSLLESPMRGDSAGWSNNLADATFTRRSESENLPPGAQMLRVIFNSGTWDTRDGASHPTVGLAVIDDCRIWIKDAEGRRRNLWPNSTFDEGEEMDKPQGRPFGWSRGGMGRGIARVLTLPNGQGRALALVDDNPRSGAEWRCDVVVDEVQAGGGNVNIEWKELYTIGAAGGHAADYPFVPSGDYVFRVQGFSPTGEPAGPAVALAFTIPQVFWKSTPFLAAGGIAGAAVVAGIARALTRRRMQREVQRLEQQRALERERTRIARDIHDDLGTSLTRVTLLSQSVRGAVAPGSPAAEELEQINRTSQEMTRALEEIVWAVDPAQDSLDGIANYLGRFAQDFLSAAGISCRLDLPVQLPPQSVAAEVRHNLFLAFKEALHNVVRHSGAREVNINLSVTATSFTLSVADDGRGFEPAPVSAGPAGRGGHGLANLRNRLAQIGGETEIASQPGQGTRVRLRLPLPSGGVAGR